MIRQPIAHQVIAAPLFSGGGIPRYVQWEHDGLNVTGFVLVVDTVEYDLGLLSPVSGTTYQAAVPGAVGSGPHDITVIAYNGAVRSDAAEVTLTW